MPVLTLQRSYKYIMYATKQPSLRINQSDLKCKKGCGFYGNADWGGYCSKCYRNQIEVERQKKSGHSPSQSQSSGSHNTPSKTGVFTKFEEKKRQQSDKKLKNFVLRKPFNLKDSSRSETKPIDRLHENSWYKNLRAEFLNKYHNYGDKVCKHFLRCVDFLICKMDVSNNKTIEDIAEIAQKYYNLYNTYLNNHEIYQDIPSDVKEQMLDCFEKHVMTVLYNQLFSSSITNDKEKDQALEERIKKLSWVTSQHLDCCITEASVEVRCLVYKAVRELLLLNAYRAPQEKLNCVVKCCLGVVEVLQHCQGGPVSADEFLPALIFVVLKCNVEMLKSNILYVTRFCNDARLMQGEAGYYFTNLCCAVSFIENLTASSLNMSEVEFDAYMSGKITSISAWKSTLIACEGLVQVCAVLDKLNTLEKDTNDIQDSSKQMHEDMEKLKDHILKNVSEVIERTPLVIKPRKTPISLDRQNSEHDLPSPLKPTNIEIESQNFENTSNQSFYAKNLNLASETQNFDQKNDKTKLKLDITPFVTVNEANLDENQTKTEDHDNFDVTPEDPQSLGLSKINYDIDFSDLSADNSIVEDLTPDKPSSYKSFTPDPFSPLGHSSSSHMLAQTPLIPVKPDDFVLPFLEEKKESILDKTEVTPTENLPSPIKPMLSGGYSGFSKQGMNIPSIPCNTGDTLKLGKSAKNKSKNSAS